MRGKIFIIFGLTITLIILLSTVNHTEKKEPKVESYESSPLSKLIEDYLTRIQEDGFTNKKIKKANFSLYFQNSNEGLQATITSTNGGFFYFYFDRDIVKPEVKGIAYINDYGFMVYVENQVDSLQIKPFVDCLHFEESESEFEKFLKVRDEIYIDPYFYIYRIEPNGNFSIIKKGVNLLEFLY